MLWYAILALSLMVAMGVLAYLFPSYALTLFRLTAIELWRQLMPALARRMTPAEEAEWRQFEREGATQKDIEAWNRKRIQRRKSPNIPPPEPPKDSLY